MAACERSSRSTSPDTRSSPCSTSSTRSAPRGSSSCATPRDVVCSIEAFNARRGQLSFGREADQSLLAYLEATAAGTRVLLQAWQERAAVSHLVRYEDLVREPTATVSGMLEYLGIDHDRRLVERMVAGAQRAIPGDAEHRTTASAAASIGRWRTDLDPALHDDARRMFVPLLEGFGYTHELAG